MATKKPNPTPPPKGRRPLDSIDSLRPSALPPELAGLDMSWDDEPASLSALDRQQPGLDIDLDATERPTAIPSIPMSELVAASMAEVDRKERTDSEFPTTPHRKGERPGGAPGVPTQPAPARDALEFDPVMESRPALLPGELPPSPVATPAPRRPTPPQSRSMAGRVGPPSSKNPQVTRTLAEAPPVTQAQVELLRQEMKDRYAMGDFSGALDIAETLLGYDADDLEAMRFSNSCRDVLTQMYVSRLGPLDQIVRVSLTPEEQRWLTLDHRAGFLLSLVDGSLTVEEVLDVSGMPKMESLKILCNLLDQRVIRLHPR